MRLLKTTALLFLTFIATRIYANNLGAYVTVINSSNTACTVSASNWNTSGITSPWDNGLSWSNNSIAGGTSFPAAYIEENDLYDGTSTGIITITPAGGTPVSVTIYEASATYSCTVGGNTKTNLVSVMATAAPGTGAQWAITVYLLPGIPVSNAWMSNDPAIQSSSLMQITIPGAHDAAMSQANPCSTFANPYSTQTQTLNFRDLCQSGVRLFDCRPVITSNSSAIMLGHYGWVSADDAQSALAKLPAPISQYLCNSLNGWCTYQLNNQYCLGLRLDTALSQIHSYMQSVKNNHEVVILEFSHYGDLVLNNIQYPFFTANEMQTLMTQIRDSLGDFLYVNDPNFLNTTIRQITAGGSKVIVMMDANNPLPPPGNPSLGMYNTPQNVVNMYAGTNNYQAMIDSEFLHRIQYPNSYYVFSWTLTQSPVQAALGVIPPSGYASFVSGMQFAAGQVPGGTTILNNYLAEYPYQSIINMTQNMLNQVNYLPQLNSALRAAKDFQNLPYPNVFYADLIGPIHFYEVQQLNAMRGK